MLALIELYGTPNSGRFGQWDIWRIPPMQNISVHAISLTGIVVAVDAWRNKSARTTASRRHLRPVDRHLATNTRLRRTGAATGGWHNTVPLRISLAKGNYGHLYQSTLHCIFSHSFMVLDNFTRYGLVLIFNLVRLQNCWNTTHSKNHRW